MRWPRPRISKEGHPNGLAGANALQWRAQLRRYAAWLVFVPSDILTGCVSLTSQSAIPHQRRFTALRTDGRWELFHQRHGNIVQVRILWIDTTIVDFTATLAATRIDAVRFMVMLSEGCLRLRMKRGELAVLDPEPTILVAAKAEMLRIMGRVSELLTDDDVLTWYMVTKLVAALETPPLPRPGQPSS